MSEDRVVDSAEIPVGIVLRINYVILAVIVLASAHLGGRESWAEDVGTGTGETELVSCGMSDVDAIRAEVMNSPTTPGNFVDRRAALGRWWRLLWAQGYDLVAFDGPARSLTYLDADSPRAPSTLDEAFAVLERIQANPVRIPEVRGPARTSLSPSMTNWTMYHGIDGRNTGYSPDAGPSQGRIAWRFPKGYHLTAKPVISDGRVYVSSPGCDVVGFCLNESTGEVIWRARQHSFDFYHVRGSSWDPVVSSDRVLFRVGGMGLNEIIVNRETGQAIAVGDKKGRESDKSYMGFGITRPHDALGVACFADAETGKLQWTYTLSHEPTGQPIVVGHTAYVADQAGEVLRLDISGRSVDWENDLQTSLIGEIDLSGESICVGSRDGRLFCLSAASGKLVWEWQCPEVSAHAFQPLSALLTHGDRIYVGSASGQLYCLNAATGAVIWSYQTGGWIRSKPAVIDDTIFVATIDGDLCAVVDQGAEARSKWEVRVGAHGCVADLVANKNRILVSSRDHILYSIHPDSGEVQWKHGIIDGTWVDGEYYSCAGSKGLLTTPTLVDGVMYLSGPDGFVNAVDAEDGQEIWRFELGGDLSSTPVVAEDLVFVARQINRTGRFCALDQETGSVVWESSRFGPVWVAPVYRNGMLFFGNKRGDMFGVRASSGEMVWSYYTMKDTPLEDKSTDVSPSHGWPPGVYSNPAMDDEKVYVGSWSGFYFAFDQATGTLVWRTATTGMGKGGRPDSAAPVLHKNHLYVQKEGTHIAAIHKDSGRIVWEWKAPPGFLQNGSIAAHGDRIYGSVVRGVTLLPYHATIVAFNDVENGGDEVWRYDGGGGLTAPVITGDSVIFGSSADMFITSLDANSGSLVWRAFTGGVMLENVPTIYGARAYAHFRNGWVLAVE